MSDCLSFVTYVACDTDALVTAIKMAVEAAGGDLERRPTTNTNEDGMTEYEGGESIEGLLHLFQVMPL